MEEDRIEQIMKDFRKVIIDMTRDILITFPDRHHLNNLNSDLKNVLENTDSEQNTSLKSVFEHCKEVYPNKFFNILYQNDTIFADDDSLFLPGISFKELWQDPLLSDKSREVIWKYLQLVLFTVISTVKDKESFGDSAKLFETINDDELKSKLEETMAQMQDIFNLHKGTGGGGSGGVEGEEEGSSNSTNGEGINLGDMPNPQDIHDHVTGMLDGKLGRLAKEIAEETAADLNMDMNSSDSVNDMFKNLMKNPTKLMGIVKNVGSKLDEKMKSGDIKESDLLKEAGDIMEKMKSIPGMGNIQSMMEKMGMGGAGGMGANAMGSMMNGMMNGMMGGGSGGGGGANAMGGKGKVNVNAFQEYMKKNMKAEKHKEGMKARLAERQAAQAQQQMQQMQALAEQEEIQVEAEPQLQQTQAQQVQAQQVQKHGSLKKVNDNLVFSTGEEVLRSLAPTVAPTVEATAPSNDGEKKKKKKKNKNKKQ